MRACNPKLLNLSTSYTNDSLSSTGQSSARMHRRTFLSSTEQLNMPKRIAFFADGTWQLPRNNTNIYKLYKGLAQSSAQVAFYDDGIGSEAAGFTRALDGSVGTGILDK